MTRQIPVPSTNRPQAEPPLQAGPDPSAPHPEPKPKKSPGFFQRFIRKLKPPTLSTTARARAASAPPPIVSSGPSVVTGGRLPKLSALPNDWASKERRDAALRERGLLLPRTRDLSQVERELDRRYTKVVPLEPSQHGESAAQKIQQQWEAENENAIPGGGSGPGAAYPETLTKPNFSQPRVSEAKGQRISEQSSTASLDYPAHHTPDTSHPSPCKDYSQSESINETDCTGEALPDAHPTHSSTSSLLIPTSQSPRANRPPIVITTTSPRESLTPDPHPSLFVNGFQSCSSPIVPASISASLPALSPAETSSSFSSLPTPRDDWGDSGVIIRTGLSFSTSTTPSHQFGGIGSDAVGQVVLADQTNGEYPVELGGFEAYVERREHRKRQKSTGVFSSTSSSNYSHSTRSAGCGSTNSCATGREFIGSASSPGCLGGPQVELQQKKPTSSRRSIFRLGLSSRIANQPKLPPLPTVAGGQKPVARKPTVSAVLESRENILNQMNGIEDEESRRLSEMAFLNF